MGLKVIGFLIFFTVISFIAKNRIWRRLDKW
jgi:cytochrome c1